MTTATEQLKRLTIERDATISPDGTYRYLLRRTWWRDRARIAVVMLNPSTADATRDDQTVRRCMSLAYRDGYGGIDVVNLYSLRATNPRELDAHDDPIGPMTHEHWERVLRPAALVVAAWGGDRMATPERIDELREYARCPLFCWGTTASGAPRHPSRLGNDVPSELWRPS